MTAARRWCSGKHTAAGLGVVMALSATSLSAPARADVGGSAPAVSSSRTVAGATECPSAMPVSAALDGLVGRGLTVVHGTTPQPFRVKVLGVLANGIGAGRDLIIVEVSDLAGHHVVDQGGGIWAGMSGSPVYLGGKLLGAISYGFTSAPSRIGGVTPAVDMMKLLSRSGTATTPLADAPTAGRNSIPLPGSLRRQVAATATVATPHASMKRLPIPLSVSGVGPTRLARLQADADEAGMAVVAYAGSSRSAPSRKTAIRRPTAGGNFATALSYGDVTVGGVGTTTAVCGHRALAFGHPFNFAGATTYGANDANALAIVRDNTFGSFKMANITAPFGALDQDRLSGIRAHLGAVPLTTPLTTTVRDLDDRHTRTGRTRVTDASWLPGLAPYAVLANFDSTFDEVGDGSATSTWTIAGTRAGAKAFSVTRTNRYAARDDIAVQPAFDLAYAVDAVVNNEFERVKIKKVTFDSSVTTRFRTSRITKVAVSVNGGRYRSAATLKVKPGALLKVRVTLQGYQSATTHRVTVKIKVPKKSSGTFGVLEVTGGADTSQSAGKAGDTSSCLLAVDGCDTQQAQSFTGVLKDLVSAARNDDLSVSLDLESESSNKVLTASGSRRFASVVTGTRGIEVTVAGR